jgi:photosystem II stability/assembly factor-like uncharacterized protein
MFQRQTRQAFPTGAIFVLLAVVLGFLYLVLKNVRSEPANAREREEIEHSEAGKDAAMKPSEWFYAIRNYPDRVPDIRAYTRAIKEARGAISSVQPRSGYPGFTTPWTLEGPGNIGARINTIEVNPLNPNIIYIGYSGGGLWKTTDGGQTWNPLFDDRDFLGIGDIALDPLDPNTVFVGTGDPNISIHPFIGDGVWKSTDGGQSWTSLGLAPQRIVSRLIVHPTDPDIIYAATMGLPFERNNDRGLYKTTDGGQTWQQVLFVSNQAGIIDLVMSPNDPNVLYAAAWDRIRSNSESTVSGPNARVWKTTNGGQTWTALAGGLPLDEKCRISLAVDPQNGNHVYASYTSPPPYIDFEALYETTDGGQSWLPLPVSGLDLGFRGGFAWYFGGMVINPHNPSDIWLLGVTSYRSLDGGQTWESAIDFDDGVHADHHDLVFLGPTSFLVGTDGGLYRSNNNSQSWFKTENIPTTQFYRVAYNPTQPDWYYGGAQDNGTLGGNSQDLNFWQRLYGGDGFQAVFHPTDPNIYYYEWQNGNIVGPTDGGWFDNATQGIESSDRRSWDMQYIMSRHDYDIMYTGTYRVYIAAGHPPFWVPISPDLTDGSPSPEEDRFHTISTLDESPLDPEIVYVGTTDGNVWRGDPANENWTNITAGLPDRYVSSVKASPNHTDHVFATHSGYRSNDFSPLLHRSNDRGATWTSIAGDLPSLSINDLFVLPGYQDSVLFVATDGGVWGTLDGGNHWERLGAGMPLVPVFDLAYNEALNTLVAGTHARSIMSFAIDSLELDESSAPTPGNTRTAFLSVTPSPSTDQATLAIENLSFKKTAQITVTTVAGQVVGRYELRGGNRSEVPLPVHEWPAGAYVAFAQTDGRVWGQKKFLVLGR